MAGLTIEQLEQLEDVLRWGDMAANASGRIDDAIDIVKAEIARRKHGPFTLAEAIASGRPFRRPEWKSFAGRLEDCDDVGYMFFYFHTGPEPAYADDITATDYELQEEQP